MAPKVHWRQRAAFRRRPTLFLRCLLLLLACLLANALLWTVSAITFTRQATDGPDRDTLHLLSPCLLAWTLGLRHGLDADHISIIDNATRRIASLPRDASKPHLGLRRPVTCGQFFSLGHSTIVVSVLIAVAVSTSVVNRLGGVSEVGGIIGASVSGVFLFLFGVINSVLLWRSWRASRRLQQRGSALPAIQAPTRAKEKEAVNDAKNFDGSISETSTVKDDHDASDNRDNSMTPDKAIAVDHADSGVETGEKGHGHHFTGIFSRLARPLLRMVDRRLSLPDDNFCDDWNWWKLCGSLSCECRGKGDRYCRYRKAKLKVKEACRGTSA